MSGVTAILGEHGYYFLDNDGMAVQKQHRGEIQRTHAWFYELFKVHRHRATTASAATYRHIIVPNKETALRQYLPATKYEEFGPTLANRYVELCKTDWTYFDKDWRADSGQFLKLDTHWTDRGCIEYMRAAFSHFGMTNVTALLGALPLSTTTQDIPGDLGSRAGVAAERVEVLAPSSPKAVKLIDNSLRNTGALSRFTLPVAPIRERVLFLHDSFGVNAKKFLPELFSDILFLHCADYDDGFVDAFKPSLVVFMQIERFLPRLPQNGASYAAMLVDESRKKGASSDLSYIYRMAA